MDIDQQEFVNEILPGLWLGDIRAAHDEVFLGTKKISVIINCTEQLGSIDDPSFEKYRLSVIDNLDPRQIALMYTLLDHVADIIHRSLGAGKNVLVHCYAGRQRSLSAIVAFLMKYAKLGYASTIELIRTKRKVAGYPTVNFEDALLRYEKDLIRIRKEDAALNSVAKVRKARK